MKCIFLIAMVAMIGLSAASLDVQIISPEDGTRIELGSKVVARIIMEVAGEENISTRLLVDGSPTKGLAWKPMAPGEYVLTIQAANNPDFVGAVSDFVVVTVYDDSPIRGRYLDSTHRASGHTHDKTSTAWHHKRSSRSRFGGVSAALDVAYQGSDAFFFGLNFCINGGQCSAFLCLDILDFIIFFGYGICGFV